MPDGICSIEGCEKPTRCRGWCEVHYFRWWRHGDPLIRLTRGRSNSPTPDNYGAAHDRLNDRRGPATKHLCIQCGSPAKQWAYQHDCPDERQSPLGPYSLDLNRYKPMCVPCHKRMDVPRKTHCRQGHPYDEANTYVDPRGVHQCRICRNDAVRRYVARKRTA